MKYPSLLLAALVASFLPMPVSAAEAPISPEVQAVIDAVGPKAAFPGAEGFGANTPGGRGGRVIVVTTLDDSGPGSFRAACEADGPRIVTFEVGGNIVLKSRITVTHPYLTIAGQTALGDGICLRDYTFGVATHDVIVRYLRSRLGDVTAQEDDCIDVLNGAHDVIIDHCSATWSIDECLSISGNDANITVQWCLIGESLNQSKHSKGAHGYGSLSRANGPVSWHHNLWIHNDARNPRLGDNYDRGPTFPVFDVRNNVIYDYGATASGLTQGNLKVNYVANYVRPGPSSKALTPIHIGNKPKDSNIAFYIRENVFEGNDALTADNTKFIDLYEIEGKPQARTIGTPFAAPVIKTVPAREALDLVLATVGASWPVRDSVDARLIEEVRTHGGHIINSQAEVGGWPELKGGAPRADTDKDGMPDEWEKLHKQNPADPADANRVGRTGYTHIEDYLNRI
ncbi:MAG TPA: hypothetical protein VG838_01460 [Opitutaceae bacterium]|nr:hypothetical protein [Opitutaceae bacterium]